MSLFEFNKIFGFIPPKKRNHAFQVTPGWCAHPVVHKLFELHGHQFVTEGIISHPQQNEAKQFSFTIALIFDGIKGKGCVWNITISPPDKSLKMAMDQDADTNSIVDGLKKIANQISRTMPLIKGSCVKIRIGHCGHYQPIIEVSMNFLHGVYKIQTQALIEMPGWKQWIQSIRPWGIMTPVPDLWAKIDKSDIENKLHHIGSRLLRRVENCRKIGTGMEASNVRLSPNGSQTVLISDIHELPREERRKRSDGWTQLESQKPPTLPPTRPKSTPKVKIVAPPKVEMKKIGEEKEVKPPPSPPKVKVQKFEIDPTDAPDPFSEPKSVDLRKRYPPK